MNPTRRHRALAVTRLRMAAAPALGALSLDGADIRSAAAAGTPVGLVTGRMSGSALTLMDSAGGRFALSGTTIVAGATATAYDPATGYRHTITVRETKAGFADRDTVLAVNVLPPIKVVAIGDSLTALAGCYADKWAADNPAIPFAKEAQGGIGVGTPDDAPGTASLWGKRDAIIAAAPSLVTVFIGANDGAVPAATWIDRLDQLVTALKARRPNLKVVVATLHPTGTAGSAPERAAKNALIEARRGTVYDDVMGFWDHPYLAEATAGQAPYYTDYVHLTGPGHDLLKPVYAAVADSFAKPAASIAFAFPDATNTPVSTAVSALGVVSGLPPCATASAVLSGAGQIALGKGAAGAGPVTVRNGAVLMLTQTSSASLATTTNSTVTCAGFADTWSVSTVYPAITLAMAPERAQATVPSASIVTRAITWPAGERYAIVSLVSRVAGTVTIGGSAATLVSQSTPTNATGNRWIAIYRVAGVQPAGAADLVVTLSGSTTELGYAGFTTPAAATITDTVARDQTTGGSPKITSSALDVNVGGIGVCAIYSASAGASWNNGTELFTTADSVSNRFLSAASYPAGSVVPSYNYGASTAAPMAGAALA